MYEKASCTCKLVVLLIKPIAFVAFPSPSPSSYLKVPVVWRRSVEWPKATRFLGGSGVCPRKLCAEIQSKTIVSNVTVVFYFKILKIIIIKLGDNGDNA